MIVNKNKIDKKTQKTGVLSMFFKVVWTIWLITIGVISFLTIAFIIRQFLDPIPEDFNDLPIPTTETTAEELPTTSKVEQKKPAVAEQKAVAVEQKKPAVAAVVEQRPDIYVSENIDKQQLQTESDVNKITDPVVVTQSTKHQEVIERNVQQKQSQEESKHKQHQLPEKNEIDNNIFDNIKVLFNGFLAWFQWLGKVTIQLSTEEKTYRDDY